MGNAQSYGVASLTVCSVYFVYVYIYRSHKLLQVSVLHCDKLPSFAYLYIKYLTRVLTRRTGCLHKTPTPQKKSEVAFTVRECRLETVMLRRFCSRGGYGWDYPETEYRDLPLCFPEFLCGRLLLMLLTDDNFRLSPAGLVPVCQSLKTHQPIDELKKGPFMLQVQVLLYRQIDAGVEVDICLSANSCSGSPVWESVLTLLSKNKLHKANSRLKKTENDSEQFSGVNFNFGQTNCFECLCLAKCNKRKYMKKQGKGDTASIPLSSPTGSSSVQVYHDYQKVAITMHPGNGHATENGSRNGRDQVTSRMPDYISKSQDQRYTMKEESLYRNSMWMMDSSSQVYSGQEDNSTDPHECLTDTSTLTFVDARTTEDSAESHSLHGVTMVYLKEFVLIDDDDDGDMSLREKTVTDLSVMDGRAADLVCGRLFSTSSGSVSECTPAAGQILDVCTTCHTNATCDNKPNSSGKVCNCKYGFVGNGRTYCQDKDECQIGASKICGQHTQCHNTYGSYYCTCLSGYSPTNYMATFIPNDGTYCQDIDECKITGLCGQGGWCRNLEGSFECACLLGYQIHNGAEPFHPHRDKASCKVVDCGQPAPVEDTVLLSVTGTTYGNVATYVCDEGFIWASGDNTSVCGANGLWRGPTVVCEEINCQEPISKPHSKVLWDGTFHIGSVAHYQCYEGYHTRSLKNYSVCGENGLWEDTDLWCEAKCGPVPFLANSEVVWHNRSVVIHRCMDGYHIWKGSNISVCGSSGVWQKATLRCRVVDCGQPAPVEDTVLLSVTGTTYGNVATYVCDEGFIWASGDNTSVCGANGLWRGPTAVCEEINCQQPISKPHSKVLWDGTFHIGSVAHYQCDEGYHTRSLKNYSVCGENGLWEDIDLWCEAKCGPVPFLANSEVVWHNRSVVIYRCMDGYHIWKGSNISVCGSSGVWQKATLRCRVIKPPINHLYVVNEKCVHWKAEKYEEDTEAYKAIKSSCVLWAKIKVDADDVSLAAMAAVLSVSVIFSIMGAYSYKSCQAVKPVWSMALTKTKGRHYYGNSGNVQIRQSKNVCTGPLNEFHIRSGCFFSSDGHRCTAAAGLEFTMAQNQVILQFRFATFGDSMLQKMNLLRHQRRFCDVTVRINQLEVPGHKVVFAAGSSFLRDQFILQQDSREVQISMIQEAEVGQQLLLSCYTGQLEFPELELVHYLTVASFLQMGHIVEQCTQALSKFIKPQAAHQLEVDVSMRREKREEGSSTQAQREQDRSQVRTVNQQMEEILSRRPRQSMVNDITIVKVESVSDVAENSNSGHFSTSPPAALNSPEPQHSLINSTVDSRSSEMPVPPGIAGYPLSPPPPSPPAEKHSAHQRNYDKPLQWYHQCPKCARVFRQLENYANHLKMHKLFMCLLCGKTFTQKGNLHRHMRVHAGIKPFQCKICGKTFTQKCSLLDHLNLHSGDKPHRCNYCDMVFAHKPVLRKHLKQIHGKNSFDNANEGTLHDGGLDFDFGRI
ncbi:hypothetical protein F2P81_013657 [Scophthalmus maximus]|uniref:Zinc finger and BTB domain-containing protein 26-like n=1 Tax=Scophthalmus maximus TaxID=52904 RepID=A0A6A4SRF3_SCOMX|nr:hypothetical protein F2P81_013657 [Scophthalmus maximus]